MLRSEAITVGQEGEEAPLVVLHGACTLEGLEFVEVVRADRRVEAEVDEVDEARSGNDPEVLLHLVVPVRRGSVQVK